MPTLSLPISEPVAISSDERVFFIALGVRVVRLRKDRDTTQAQLTGLISVSVNFEV